MFPKKKTLKVFFRSLCEVSHFFLCFNNFKDITICIILCLKSGVWAIFDGLSFTIPGALLRWGGANWGLILGFWDFCSIGPGESSFWEIIWGECPPPPGLPPGLPRHVHGPPGALHHPQLRAGQPRAARHRRLLPDSPVHPGGPAVVPCPSSGANLGGVLLRRELNQMQQPTHLATAQIPCEDKLVFGRMPPTCFTTCASHWRFVYGFAKLVDEGW